MTWKRKERTWYACGHILSTAITSLLFRPKIVGRQNIPKEGCVLIAPNHRSMLDIPVLGCATFRPMRFMAKKDLFRNKLIKWYFETNGSFSIDKNDSDPAAIKKAISVLKDGDALVVFPEGRRNKNESVGELESGVSFIAVKGQAPVLPVAIFGLDKKIKIRFGFLPVLTKAKVVVGTPITAHLQAKGKTSEITNALNLDLASELEKLYSEAKTI